MSTDNVTTKQRRGKQWTSEEDSIVLKFAGKGYGWAKEASKSIDRSSASIVARSKEIGYSYKPPVNIRFFDSWSQDMAYILGYLWADGTIQYKSKPTAARVSLRCTQSDDALIKEIAVTMGATAKIQTIPAKDVPYSGSKSGVIHSKALTSISINSVDLVKALVGTHGLVPNKSHVDPNYPSIPDEYVASFARGNFDGDGCVYRMSPGSPSVMFYGSERFLHGLMAQMCHVLNLAPRSIYDNRGTLKYMSWSAIADVTKIFNAFYGSGGICLQRKKEKWLAIANEKSS